MTQIDNGGPAFPTDNERPVASNAWHYQGMTLRDYLAAKALPAIFKDYAESAQKVGWDDGWQDGVAIDAYTLADAMLRARGGMTDPCPHAAKLRRLQTENAEHFGEIAVLKEQRDELLAALKLTKERFIAKCEESLVTFNGKDVDTIEAIVYAIVKATGETK